MKYQLRFTQTGMTDIHLLARSRGLKLDDYEGMADLVEALVRGVQHLRQELRERPPRRDHGQRHRGSDRRTVPAVTPDVPLAL